jgi:hypothetical protein
MKMKITGENYNAIRAEMRKTWNAKQDIIRTYPPAHLESRRFRWDLFWASRIVVGRWPEEGKTHIPLGEEVNDTHLDTAFRKIVKELVLDSLFHSGNVIA